jgi:hypothetical protein
MFPILKCNIIIYVTISHRDGTQNFLQSTHLVIALGFVTVYTGRIFLQVHIFISPDLYTMMWDIILLVCNTLQWHKESVRNYVVYFKLDMYSKMWDVRFYEFVMNFVIYSILHWQRNTP